MIGSSRCGFSWRRRTCAGASWLGSGRRTSTYARPGSPRPCPGSSSTGTPSSPSPRPRMDTGRWPSTPSRCRQSGTTSSGGGLNTEPSHTSALLFCWPDGHPVHPQTITDRFFRLSREAGLPFIRLHDVQHSYATAALKAGVHPKIVSERLGHASVAFTLQTYSHVIEGMDEAAASEIAAYILGPFPAPEGPPSPFGAVPPAAEDDGDDGASGVPISA